MSNLFINQSNLIEVLNDYLANSPFKSTGLTINRNGMCAGLAALYLKSKAKGKEKKFFAKIQKIVSLRREDYQDNDALLAKFCRNLEYAFNTKKYKHGVQQYDLDRILSNSKDTFTPGLSFGLVTNRHTLANLIADNIIEEDMVRLGANGHAIAMFKRAGLYYLYDPNSKTGEKKFASLEELCDEIFWCFYSSESNAIPIKLKTFRYASRRNALSLPPSLALNPHDVLKYIDTDADPDYSLSLLESAELNNTEIVNELLNLNADPLLEQSSGLNAFSLASAWGKKEMTDLILSHAGDRINDETLIAALIGALQFNVSTYDDLLKYVCLHKPDLIDANLTNLFLAACQSGNAQLIAEILTFNKEALESHFNTALQFAIQTGNESCVNTLMTTFPASLSDSILSECRLIAIQHGHYTCFQTLLNYALPQKNDAQAAIEVGNLRLLETIIPFIDLGIDEVKLAIKANHPTIVNRLMSGEAIDEQTSLLKNVLNDQEDSFSLLLDWEPKFLVDLLLYAIVNNKDKLATFLLQNDIGLSSTYSNGISQLYLASKRGDFTLTSRLLAAGLDPLESANAVSCDSDTENHSILFHTAQNSIGNPELKKMITLLIDHLLMYELSNHQYNKILIAAAYINDPDIIAKLYAFGCDFNFQYQGKNVLEHAFLANNMAIIPNLIRSGASLAEMKDGGRGVLIAFCQEGNHQIVDELLFNNPHLQSLVIEDDIVKLLSQAARTGDTKVIKPLLSLTSTISFENQRKILLKAARSHQAEFIDALMSAGWQLSHGEYKEILYQAYDEKIILNRKMDAKLLQFSFLCGHKHIYDFILHQGNYLKELTANPFPNSSMRWYLQAINTGEQNFTIFNCNDRMKLRNACKFGNLTIAKYLIEVKNVAVDKYDYQPILVAAQFGNKEVVNFFLSRMTQVQIEALILEQAAHKQFAVVACILESLNPENISDKIFDDLMTYQGDIRNEYNDVTLFSAFRHEIPRKDAHARKECVMLNQNALGDLLHKLNTISSEESKKLSNYS